MAEKEEEAETLAALKRAVQQIDGRYWQCHYEKLRALKGSAGSSSGNKSSSSSGSNVKPKSGSTPALSGGSLAQSSNQKPNQSKGSTLSSSSHCPNTQRTYTDKLGKNSKLTQAKKNRWKRFNLCMFCGGNHSLADCQKHSTTEAKG